MEREVTFIHTADLHLDSPFKGLTDMPADLFEEIRESTFQALTNLVNTAIEEEIDFVLIAGDLFDNEKQSLKAQIRLKHAFERLQTENISVYLSYGNHDFLKGNIHQVTYPDNVHIFPDEEVRAINFEKNGEVLAKIYGFSYVSRAVVDNKTKEYAIKNPEVPFHIAMLHGSIQGNEEHATYAPFQLSELAQKEFHYWALGHIHKRSLLKKDPYIVYPGNTQGRHRKETGEKGCYLVKLTTNQTELSFLPLQAIEFTALTIDVSACEKAFQLEPIITQKISELSPSSPQLLDITFTAKNTKLRNWEREGQLADIIEIVNESLATQQPWQFIFNTSIEINEHLEPHETSFGEHFLGELQASFEESASLEYIQELYQHRKARKYLDLPTPEEEQVWLKEARDRLFDQMLKGGGA